MDGNRRWAKKQGMRAWYGHRQGTEAVRTVVNFCLDQCIRYLSLYTFSLENFKRSALEKRYLFNLLVKQVEKELPVFMQKGIKVRFIGDRNFFPSSVHSTCERVEQKTVHCDCLYLNLLFCYGGQQELVAGIKDIAREVKSGNLSEEEITEEKLTHYLWTGAIPAPDLIIRTGGVQRLSNFLLYQAAYSELCFLDCLWPELSKVDLENVIDSFEKRKRNFGT